MTPCEWTSRTSETVKTKAVKTASPMPAMREVRVIGEAPREERARLRKTPGGCTTWKPVDQAAGRPIVTSSSLDHYSLKWSWRQCICSAPHLVLS